MTYVSLLSFTVWTLMEKAELRLDLCDSQIGLPPPHPPPQRGEWGREGRQSFRDRRIAPPPYRPPHAGEGRVGDARHRVKLFSESSSWSAVRSSGKGATASWGIRGVACRERA